jgi:hypothetical protein
MFVCLYVCTYIWFEISLQQPKTTANEKGDPVIHHLRPSTFRNPIKAAQSTYSM